MIGALIPNSLSMSLDNPHALKVLLTKEIPAKGLTLFDIFCNFIPKKLSFLFVLFDATKIGEFFQSSNHCVLYLYTMFYDGVNVN
jgi:hypothetical protein